MSWAESQARIDATAAHRGHATSTLGRRNISHFEPDGLGYLRGLGATYAAAGLMPPSTRSDGRISERMLQRARAVKARLDDLMNPNRRKR